MSFRSVLANTVTFSNVVKAILAVNEEAPFKFTNDGVIVKCFDPAIVMMIDLKLPSNAFSLYEVQNEFTVGADVSKLKKFVGSGSKEERLLWKVEGNMMHLIITSEDVVRKLSMPTLSLDKEVKEREFDFDVKVSLDPSTFAKYAASVLDFGDVIKLESSEDFLIVSSLDEVIKSKASFELKKTKTLGFECKSKCASFYNAEFFSSLLSIAPSSKTMRICFSQNHPLMVEYEVPNLERCRYFLANREEI